MRNSTYIIIVTYNGMSWLKQCLDSCGEHSVIIVDNASSDTTLSFIETHYPNVTLLKQTVNLGFGQSNNIGIRYALDNGAEHVFLLNQDAYLVDSVLEKLIACQQQHPQYGILSPIHVTKDKNRLDKNFSNFMLTERTGQFYSDFVLGNTLSTVYDVPFVNAAAWLISKACLETVGGFDPIFFHYGEDDNYCQRAIYHGFKIGVLPTVYVIHDREDRIYMKPALFSHEYYNNVEKTSKIIYGDINTDNSLPLKIRKLRKTILKLKLNLKFERAAAYQKELILLKKAEPLIKKSRRINKTKGAHYLKVSI